MLCNVVVCNEIMYCAIPYYAKGEYCAMPVSSFNCQSTGQFDLSDIRMFSSAGIPNEFALEYQFMFWYPTFTLTNVPLTVSRNLNLYGDKYFLGEVAYINFGAIAAVDFIQYDVHQGRFCLGLPVPVFINANNNTSANTFTGVFNSDRLRARSLFWDLTDGVTMRLDIAWVFQTIEYLPGQTNLEVI